MNDDYDSPWKDVLERYFQEFMVFFFPRAAADIDWGKGYESLDTELRQVVRDAETGKRLADKLMKVWRDDGKTQLVLIHIEVQGNYDKAFAERMFVYHYRLYDRFRQPIVSLGVLGDDSHKWRPDRYQAELWGCKEVVREQSDLLRTSLIGQILRSFSLNRARYSPQMIEKYDPISLALATIAVLGQPPKYFYVFRQSNWWIMIRVGKSWRQAEIRSRSW